MFLRDTSPDIEFSISLDEKDKAITFYIDGEKLIKKLRSERMMNRE